MIKLPKQVKEIIKKLRDKGYEAYAVGACVRNSLLGDKPLDWDVATNAGLDVLKELFKDGKVMRISPPIDPKHREKRISPLPMTFMKMSREETSR